MMKTVTSIIILYFLLLASCAGQGVTQQAIVTLRDQDLKEASWALQQTPITVTASHCDRSAGGIHDFYSEGDYWWPDSLNSEAPYVQRDGLTNPDNFSAHRLAMIRFSKIVASLASAYLLTLDEKYVQYALPHLKAWFIDDATRMNPNLQYAQAIKGRATGRSIGIIDTIHLIEVTQGVLVMSSAKSFDKKLLEGVITWFKDYIAWLTTHPYGIEEMNAKNNHGTCWVLQVSAFAKLTGQKDILNFCIQRYKSVLLPDQMAIDGSFPLELKRTKPYGYSIFNLDAMVMICQILSTDKNNLWVYETSDKKSIRKGIEFLYPYLEDKNQWPFSRDVMYWDYWPVAQPSLIFGSLAFKAQSWLSTWTRLDHDPAEQEIIRNLPVRHPLIWMNDI